ncbi:MAG: DUF2325 domain-containing protein [Burkholderiales bacterium]|nr:DUF2325 domain-containing protein [Burkholderiales bacterium]
MCERYPYAGHDTAAPDAESAHRPAAQPVFGTAPAQGSRRTRLWEMPGHTHCPVIGVCLPMPALRRLLGKIVAGGMLHDDYEFHVAAVAECGRRGAIAERLQRELDRRYAPTLRRYAQAKSGAALAALWSQALQGPDVAGALWATLTHARCEEDLRELVCREIHMFQHQVGACNRADLQRHEQLQDEHAVLSRELSTLKARRTHALAQRAAQLENLNAELMRARAQLIERDSALAIVREELAQLKATLPELATRLDLARRVELQRHRIHELERNRCAWQQSAGQDQQRAQALAQEVAALRAATARQQNAAQAAQRPCAPADLRDKAVLCVGGRTASVPSYRQLIEETGGKFSHHDGGEQNSPAQLEASLAAADLVICQTGCISHSAYWRVKDHCKRTGKRCVFVEQPSASSLVRCLRELDDLKTP